MRFDDIDFQMRKYEKSLDQVILDDMYLVARLDGRGFSKFTKKQNFEKPFDVNFRDLMVKTTRDLMEISGFRIIYAYTESDEISLLFHPKENSFGRKTRKINSTLAAQASAFLSLQVGEVVTFDCRVIPLPNIERVMDYFCWRQEDSHRNSLNGWAYWTLRKEGISKRKATAMLSGQGVAFKNDLLFAKGINYNNLPLWQKRGVGLYYMEVSHRGYNPKEDKVVLTRRKRLYENMELNSGEEYRRLIGRILDVT